MNLYNNIVTDRGLNLFGDCVAEYVGRREYFSSWGHSKMYTPAIIANSQTQRVLTKKPKWCICQIYKIFSGTRDTIRHLKIFRVISNEMPILLLI